MKKQTIMSFLSALLFVSVLVPVSVFAQADVDPNPNTGSCVSIANNLRYRSRDVATNGEVSTLQDFLQSHNFLNSEPTGYFGLLTLKAAKDFQSANGISPTGYVGPITRAKIASLSCGTTVTPDVSPTPTSTPTPVPVSYNSGCYKGAVYSSTTGEKCSTTPTYKAGCNSYDGYSSTTGEPCSREIPKPKPVYPPGCSSYDGYSSTTGQACNGSTSENICNGKCTPDDGSYCPEGGYDSRTGFRCGCTSTSGFSSTTGEACGGSSDNSTQTSVGVCEYANPPSGYHYEGGQPYPVCGAHLEPDSSGSGTDGSEPTYPTGCYSNEGYSAITGEPCKTE